MLNIKSKIAHAKTKFLSTDKKRILGMVGVALTVAAIDTITYRRTAKSCGYNPNLLMFAPNIIKAANGAVVGNNRPGALKYLTYVVVRQSILNKVLAPVVNSIVRTVIYKND